MMILFSNADNGAISSTLLFIYVRVGINVIICFYSGNLITSSIEVHSYINSLSATAVILNFYSFLYITCRGNNK